MSEEQRRALIGRNLGIQPISHGQIHTCQIALPNSEKVEIDFSRRQVLETSLLEYQSNLVPLIVRRTEVYGEDFDYEIIFGADWLKVAQDLEIEMLWTWVFDMTDEQATLAKQQMEQLLGTTDPPTVPPDSSNNENLADKKLQLMSDSLKQALNSSLNRFKDEFSEKLNNSNYKLDDLNSVVLHLSEQINTLYQKLEQGVRTKRRVVEIGEKVNLLIADEKEISNSLRSIGTSNERVEAALAAIQYWKQSDRELTWDNLAVSARAKSGSEYKIKNFAKGTYEALQAIGEI